MPLERDPQTGRLRVVPMRRVETEGEDPFFDLDVDAIDGAAAPAPAPAEDEGGFGQYVPLAIRGLSALVPGGPLGALAGGLGEGAAQLIEGDFNPAQIAAQAGLGFIPFGRTAGVLRTAGKAAAHGAVGGAGTKLAEQIHEGDFDLGELASEAKRGAIIGGAAGGAGYAALRRFLGEGASTAAAGDARLRRIPGERAEFEMSGTPGQVATGRAVASGPTTSRVPYRGPIEARDPGAETALGGVVESAQDSVARRSGRDPLAEMLGAPEPPALPAPAPRSLEDELIDALNDLRRDPTLPSRPSNPLAAPANPLAETLGVRSAVRVADPAQSPLAHLGRLDDLAAQRGRTAGEVDLTDELNALAGEGAGAGAGARAGAEAEDPLSRLFRPRVRIPAEGVGSDAELRTLLAEAERGHASFGSDIAEAAAAERLHRELAVLDDEYARLSALSDAELPRVAGGSGGAATGIAPPGREGHFTLPETRVPDAQYDAVRRMLGIEESPAAVAERRVRDVGSPTGTERRGLDPRISGIMGDETGATSTELLINLLRLPIGGALGATFDPENRTRGALIGTGLGAASLAPNLAKNIERLRYFSLLAGPAQAKNILGNIGVTGHEAAVRALTGDQDGARRLLREFFSPETLRDVRTAYGRNDLPLDRFDVVDDSYRRGVLGIPGRILGATDEAVKNAMERGGLSRAEASRLTFTAEPETALGQWLLSGHRKFPALRTVLPFVKTATNQAEQGILPWVRFAQGDRSPRTLSQLGLALGVGALGAEYGGELGDTTAGKVAAPFLAAAAGPAAIPFAIGSALGYGLEQDKTAPELLSGAAQELRYSLPFPSEYAFSPAALLSTFVPSGLRYLNPDTEERDTRGSIFGPAIAKIPFLSETLPPR